MPKLALGCPAGIVTVMGTVASLVAVELNVTTRAAFVEVLRRTVAVVAGLRPSATTLLGMLMVSVGPSSSVTISVWATVGPIGWPVIESMTNAEMTLV